MSKLFMFEKPLGMRDALPGYFQTKRNVQRVINDEWESWGYLPVETPTLEYYDTVGSASAILDHQLFKLLDQQGRTLVLRPDMTAPIARVTASGLQNQHFPIRLAYHTNVFRAQQLEAGRPAEFEQLGVELIGDGTSSANGEVVSLMIEALRKTGLTTFQITVGHVGYVNALLEEVLGNDERADDLRRFLYEKNYVGYRQHVENLPLSSLDKKKLNSLLRLRGDWRTLDEALNLVQTPAAKEAVEELQELRTVLEHYELSDYIKLDFNLFMHMSYYTGIVFESYGNNLGVPLGSGGRYDELLQQFNRPAQAVGFGLRLDLLVEALGLTGAVPSQTCILFSPERRPEAVEHARKLRETGKRVVLQDIRGVEDVDQLSESYEDVVTMIGKKKEGSSHE